MEDFIELKERAKMLEDVRQKGKKVYKIWDIVVVVILAVLSDCNEWSEIEDFAYERRDFLKKFLKLTGGIPSAKTYERVIGMIDSKELNRIFVEFCQRIQTPKKKEFKEILSFDGKVEKGSARQEGLFYKECKPLNVLNVYSDKLEMCIDQEMIEDKTHDANGDWTFFCKSCSEELDLNSAMIVALCDLYKIADISEYNTLKKNTQSENGNITVKNDDKYEQWLTDIKDKIAETNMARNGQLRSDFSGIKISR